MFSGAGLFVLSRFVLSPNELGAFSSFMAVFCLGSLVGSVSGVPGGLGVLDAVMLRLQTGRHHVHETAAALILYRVIYFLGPLALTLAGEAASQGVSVARLTAARHRSGGSGRRRLAERLPGGPAHRRVMKANSLG